MIRVCLLMSLMLAAGCSWDVHQANADCAAQAGCVSSFPSLGYGPIQAQAVAPDAVPSRQPQR